MTLPYDEVPAPVAAFWALKEASLTCRPESIDSKMDELYDIVLTLRNDGHHRALDLHAVWVDLREAIDELRERN